MSTTQAPSTLLTLPKELLLRIRYHTRSLADHVNFSLTCRAIYGLYDNNFWEFACASAGYGMKLQRPDQVHKLKGKKDQLWPWAGLARIIVNDRAFFKPFQQYKTLPNYAVRQREVGPSALQKPTVLKATQVHKLKHPPRLVSLESEDTWDSDIYARFAAILTNNKKTKSVAILDHPFLSNRFITTPPINELRIDDGSYDEYYATLDFCSPSDYFEMDPPPPRFIVISNENGVTVGDVYLRYAEQMDKHGCPFHSDSPMSFSGFYLNGIVLHVEWV